MNHPSPNRLLSLGLTAADLAGKPYAAYYQPQMGGLPSHAQAALLTGPVAAPLLPRLSDAPQLLLTPETELENGFGFQEDGTLHVAIRTELPDVTPEMIDFWFGWHSAEPARYKLWHPRAHVHAQWESAESPQQAQSKGRARYVGRVSFVDEYLGSRLQQVAIGFLSPATLGFDESLLADPQQATVVAARISFASAPLDVGYLVHHVRKIAGGSEMRSRFWLGGSHASVRAGGLRMRVPSQLARRIRAPSIEEGRDLLVHCSQEMSHLARFLPKLYAELYELP
jgi:hypothetical protein